MESPSPPPSSAPASAATSPWPLIAPSKLHLMCNYGSHIVPRLHDKSLFYVGGKTRIVALDRRSISASHSDLIAHLSRILYQNRPFHLKYLLPNEDLDSLISIITDEKFLLMGMGLVSDLEVPLDSRSNSGGGGKPGAESLI